ICGQLLNEEDKRRLKAELKEVKLVSQPKNTNPAKQPKKESVPRGDLPNSTKKKEKSKDKDTVVNQPPEEDRPALSPELEKWLPKLGDPNKIENNIPRVIIGLAGTDHSNTQFACLACWIARRHGVPSEKALLALDKHYRLKQDSDGG